MAGVPPEIAATLVNELMAMNPHDPINLYLTMPTLGMTSADPDYTAASNWATNYLDVVVNPASTQRAAGFSAIDSRCKVYVEHSNETWNFGAYVPCLYQSWRGQLLFGSGFDISTYAMIRSVQMVRDCKAAFPPASWPQIKYVMGTWSTFGDLVYNADRFYGNANYRSAIAGGTTPMAEHDYANFAGYFSNDLTSGPNCLATCLAQWLAAIPNQAGMDAAVAAYIQGFKTYGNQTQTIDTYLSDYLGGTHGAATAAVAQGKGIVGYEGGWQADVGDPNNLAKSHVFYESFASFINGSPNVTALGSGLTLPVGNYIVGPGIPAFTTVVASPAPGAGTFTMSAGYTGATGQGYCVSLTPTAMFYAAAKSSQAWKTVHRTWFDGAAALPGSYAPAEFIIQNAGNLSWCHTFWRDSYLAGNESGGFDPDFIEQGNRNRGG